MSKGQKPALSFWGLLGRVAGFLFGVSLTVFAVLTMTGDIVFLNGAGEPTTNVFNRILLGLVYGVLGLTSAGAAIAGFPEAPHSSNGRTDRESGFDSDGDADGEFD
ncbi:hypothetical protein [Amycolatopsis oliviviridis]|uniref:Uncharacterized protein n=1 Tax=Amycolatopsis oliviviridis TaxID=1471590 RepID=A0ABQ3L543_9PSEU|nr:hypothetical protein [Amycolatopsis oliviviridis]GHH05277.1 hypothetical protein GCM10017790_09010 [Amycolatopsis oliviviridis]